MITTYDFRKGYRVVHRPREDGRHDIEIHSSGMRVSGTYLSIECLDCAIDALTMAVGPWETCRREAA